MENMVLHIWCKQRRMQTTSSETLNNLYLKIYRFLILVIETLNCIENKEVITCPVPCDSNNFYKVNENVKGHKYESDVKMLPKILTLSSQILNPKNYEIRFLSLSLDGLPLNSEMDSFIKISADKN